MMSFIKGLFSSSEVVEGVKQGVDKAFFTAEEKADNFHMLLQLYQPFKLAQRLLALVFCIPYAFAWLLTFLVSFIADSVETQVQMLSGDIAVIVGLIVAFYFGGGAVEGGLSEFGKRGRSNGIWH